MIPTPTHPRGGLSFAFLDQADNFLQIFFPEMAGFDQMDEKRFGGAIENAIDEFADHAANDLIFGMRGAVQEGAIPAALFQIALGFEDLHHGHHRGVSDFAALEEDLVNIADGGGTALPHKLHDFEFLRRKRVVFGTHSRYLVLINSYVKRKSKSAVRSDGPTALGASRAARPLQRNPCAFLHRCNSLWVKCLVIRKESPRTACASPLIITRVLPLQSGTLFSGFPVFRISSSVFPHTLLFFPVQPYYYLPATFYSLTGTSSL